MTPILNEIDRIVMTGDLTKLTQEQRDIHYMNVCEAMELNYRLQPLAYLNLDDPQGGRRLILYALRGATDQIRRNKKIKVTKLTKEVTEEVVTYTCEGEDKEGITEISTGSVSIKAKRGSDLANAFMAAETKSKRRMTLAFSGSGLLDETEVADINAPVSLPAGVGVTASPNLASPSPNNASGKEINKKLEDIEIDKKLASRKIEQEKSAVEQIIQKEEPVKEEKKPEPVSAKKSRDKVYEDGVASLKNKKAAPAAQVVEEQPVVQNPPDQGVLLQVSAEPVVQEKPVDAPVTPETKDSLNSRITVYKRDILPEGGMRPSKGFGINAKLIKYFMIQYPDQKSINDFTNEQLSSVLANLDAVNKLEGAAAVVALIDATIGTK